MFTSNNNKKIVGNFQACHKEEESQKHILLCPLLNDNRSLEATKYGKLYNGTVCEKVKIAKRFKENWKNSRKSLKR